MDAEPRPDLMIDEINFAALYRAIEHSFKSMEWARNLNRNLVESFHGPAYGANGKGNKPLNKMNQLVEAYAMLTAANRPKVQIIPKMGGTEHRIFGRKYQEALNNLLKEIKIERTVRQWIQDAFFCVGVVKAHRDQFRMVPYGDMAIDPGIPSVSNVPLDDWCYDTSAKAWPQVKWCADKYRIPFANLQKWVEDDPNANQSVIDQLKPTTKVSRDEQRLDQISTGELTDDDELEPMIDVADVWVQKTGKIYTCAVSDCATFRLKNVAPITWMEWTNSDVAPHHVLGFSDVPHNIMPLSPASHMNVLDRNINSVGNKAINQADRQRSNLVYPPGGADTVKSLSKVPDGHSCQGKMEGIGEVEQGGINPKTAGALQLFTQLFEEQSGNLIGLLSNSAATGTVGQEQIATAAGNRKVGQLRSRVAEALVPLFENIGLMLWEDQFHEFSTDLTAGGYTSRDSWKPGERTGNALEYNYVTNVTSMEYSPPTAQAEMLMGVMQRIFIPMQEAIMAQGGQIDYALFAQHIGDLLDTPIFEEIIRFSTPPEDTGVKPTTSLKPTGDKVYKHTSVPSAPQATGLQDAFATLQQAAPQGAVA